MRILVVEDESKVAKTLQEGLEGDTHEVSLAQTGEEGFYLINAQTFDLVILDIMLPGHSGIEILQTLRKRGLDTAVLILTAKDALEDRVFGLDSGADDYLVKPFDLPELLARIRALGRRGRLEHLSRLKADEGDEGVLVYGDRLILRQALLNLIDNAVKFAPVGGSIAVRVGKNGDGNVVVEVSDNGPGISDDDREKIFRRFYRVDKARSAPGAGLGLAIVKWAVEAHSGKIEVESAREKGTVFRIRLPLAGKQNLATSPA